MTTTDEQPRENYTLAGAMAAACFTITSVNQVGASFTPAVGPSIIVPIHPDAPDYDELRGDAIRALRRLANAGAQATEALRLLNFP